jgi:hypothetical protein
MDIERSKQFLKEYEKEFMFSEVDDDFNKLELSKDRAANYSGMDVEK